MNKSTHLILTIVIGFIITTFFSEAAEKEHPFRKGRDGLKGNERSEHIARFAPGQAAYGGNGCPEGTMSIAFAPDNLSFSILFDQFVAEAGGSSPKKRDGMSCTIIIPFDIPEGLQMEITRVDFRGFANIPQGGVASLHSIINFYERENKFGGRAKGKEKDRINLRYKFDGPMAENYEISTGSMNENGSIEAELSPCGGKTRLKISNQLVVKARSSNESITATIDSIDGSSNTLYFVNWKKCETRTPRNVR